MATRNWDPSNSDELYHYGVVGMKWGVRRARKKGGTYTYTSHGTKKYAKKAEKARQKGDTATAEKYDQYHKRSKELDRKMQSNAEKTSTGKAIAKTLLFTGGLGGRTYEAVRAASGGSNLVSRGLAYGTQALTGPLGASLARALYVRGYDGQRANEYARKKVQKFNRQTR